jgi:iron complex transport system substrate-binding protein
MRQWFKWGGWTGAVAAGCWAVLGLACAAPQAGDEKATERKVLPEWATGFFWLERQDGPDREVLVIQGSEGAGVRVFRDSAAYRAWEGGNSDRVLGPPQRGIATLSTTHVALLASWDGWGHWAGGGSVKYLQFPEAVAGLASQRFRNYGREQGLDKELLLAHPPSCITSFPFGDPLAGTGIADVVPVIELTEYLEAHPLGRAEWMRVMGWLAGAESLLSADSAFAAVAGRYEELRARVEAHQQRPEATVPEVFTGSVQDGVWHAPGGESLIARFLADAGAKYTFAEEEGAKNIQVSLERMRVVQARADAWGWVVHSPEGTDWDRLLGEGSPLADYVPASGRVFVANSAECDYFGAVIAEPDALLANLVRLLHPELPQSPESSDSGCFEWLTRTP